MSWRHRDILEAELHEPKGFTTANNGDSIWRNEQGLSEWTDREVLPAALNFVDASVAPPTTASGDIYVLSLGASIHANWGTVALKDWVRYDGVSWNVITPSKSILCYDKTLDVLMSYDGSVWATVGSGGGGGGDNISNANLTFDGNHYADLNGNSWTLGGTNPIGTEKISLQKNTLIKGSNTSPSTTGFKVVDSASNSKFEVTNSGQATVTNTFSTIPTLKAYKNATGINHQAIEIRNSDQSSGANATIDFKFATGTTAWAQIKFTKFQAFDTGVELNNQQGANVLVRKDYVVIQGSTKIGSEGISLQDDTLVKGSDTSASTTGFKVTDINDNSLLDVKNNGKTILGNTVFNPLVLNYNGTGAYGIGLDFNARNSSNAEHNFARIIQIATSISSGSENGALQLRVSSGGTITTQLLLRHDSAEFSEKVIMNKGFDSKGINTSYGSIPLQVYNSSNASLLEVHNNGVINASNLPTSSAGLISGDIWNNGGVLNIV